MRKSNIKHIADQEEVFTKYSIPRVLAKFIVPAALSQLTFLVLNLADAFFVGRTKDTFQIASMAITFPVMMLVTCVGTIFGAGGNANIATELGKGNRERAKNFSVFSLYAASAMVVVLSIILLVARRPILYMIGADDNSFGFCADYLFWFFHIGCVPLWCCLRYFLNCFWQKENPISLLLVLDWRAY